MHNMLHACFTTELVLSPKKNSTVLVGSFDTGEMMKCSQVVLKKLHGSSTDIEKEIKNCKLVQKLAMQRGGHFCEIISVGTFQSIDSWVPHSESSICMRKYDMDLDALMNASEAVDITTTRITSWCACVSSTMQLLHEINMMHLDIKPQNLLFKHDTPDELFLCDFGSMLEHGTLIHEQFVGTVQYASPEQFKQKNVNLSSDVWAFGCILMQMLSRQPPWNGEQNNYKVYLRISNGEIPFDFNVACESDGEDAHALLVSTARVCLQHDQEQRPKFVTLSEHIERIRNCS